MTKKAPSSHQQQGTQPRYLLKEYLALTMMYEKVHILVEGRDDAAFIERLLDVWQKRPGKKLDVAIDQAGFFLETGSPEAGQRVEHICDSLAGHPSEHLIAGFVDRELRGFEHDGRLLDFISTHRVSGRLVWTRGHSVENYFLTADTLEEPLQDLAPSPHFQEIFNIFRRVLPSALQLGAAVTLLHQRLNNDIEPLSWRLLCDSLNRETIMICGTTVELSFPKWETKLVNKGVLRSRFQVLKSTLENTLRVVTQSDIEIARWLCHGHIGLHIAWITFSCAALEVYRNHGYEQPEKEAQNLLGAQVEHRFNVCARAWSHQVMVSQDDAPTALLNLLRV